ncbi:MAG: hypothetical protein QGF90_01120, partial [Gammaproteobacteria bacterium]|nr:hypothetical protein [Gammaproteobacteria bacterium]
TRHQKSNNSLHIVATSSMFIEQLLSHQTISHYIAKSREGNSSMFLQTSLEAGRPIAGNNIL